MESPHKPFPREVQSAEILSLMGYVVPADDKENARLIISQIILDTFEGLKMAYPKTSAKRRKGIAVDPQAAREVSTGVPGVRSQ